MKIIFFLLFSINCFSQTLNGDIRFRNEQTNDNNDHSDRNRIRIRVNGQYELKNDLTLKTQLATGTTQTSSNQTIGQGKEVSLRFQQLYVEKVYNKFSFNIGKIRNNFYRTNRSQIIWDNDFNPEGVSSSFKSKNFNFSLSYFDIDNKINHLGGQLIYLNKYFKTGLSYNRFNTQNNQFIFEEARGNSGINGYQLNFNILGLFTEINYNLYTLSLETYNNTQASNNKAHRLSVKYGKQNFVMYSYQYTEKDSTIGSLSESNIQGGRSDTRGHIIRFRYHVDDNIFFTYNQYFSETISTRKPFRRSQFDINFSF